MTWLFYLQIYSSESLLRFAFTKLNRGFQQL